MPPWLFGWEVPVSPPAKATSFLRNELQLRPAGTSLNVLFLPKYGILGEEEMEVRVPGPALSLVHLNLPHLRTVALLLPPSARLVTVHAPNVYKAVLNVVKNTAKN